jgi:hypothetical protein
MFRDLEHCILYLPQGIRISPKISIVELTYKNKKRFKEVVVVPDDDWCWIADESSDGHGSRMILADEILVWMIWQ